MQDTFNTTTFKIRRRRHSFWGRFLVLAAVFLIGGTILYLGYSFFTKTQAIRNTPLVNPASSVRPFNIVTGGNVKSASITPLGKIVQDQLKGTPGTYAEDIINLKTGETYASNEHLSFESGSLYKLWIMGEAFEQIKAGKFTADQVLSEDVTVLNQKFDIDPDLAELTSGTITMSTSNALNQMITISHNYAALLLTEKEGLSNVAKYLQEKGFNESMVGTNGDDPTTTASDIALYFEKLYKGQLADADTTGKMTTLLKAQKLNNKLPKYLPDDVVIAHKTGELDDFSHDAGIVYTPKGDYVIVMMSETPIPSDAEDKIGLVSQAVYNYFTKGGEN